MSECASCTEPVDTPKPESGFGYSCKGEPIGEATVDDGRPKSYREQGKSNGVKTPPRAMTVEQYAETQGIQDVGQARPFSVQEAIDTGDATAVRDAVQRELRDTGRTDILKKAAELVHGPRHDEYGDVFENFSRIASLWRHILGVPVSPEQVALCMIQVKVSRLCNTPGHEDSWTDIAGYAALGAELR